jgi:hypothetical protein
MKRLVPIVTIAIGWAAAPAQAHHAFSANFDVDEMVEVQGRITALQWQNPHVLMRLETAEGLTWEVESQAKNLLERTDIHAESFAVGANVALAGFPAREGRGVFALNALLADGRELILRAGRPAYFGGQAAGRPENILAAGVADAVAASAGVFRVWSMQFAGDSRFRWPATYPLTPAAAAAQARFEPGVDDPLEHCEDKGMPWIMEQPFPLELVRRGGDVVMRLEEGDTERVIHLEDTPPSGLQPSPLGYSYGRWEGDELVVRTVALSARYLNATGVPLSNAATLDERFSPTRDGSRLNYRLTVADPETFTEPLVLTSYWIWRPGERLQTYDCVPAASPAR